MRWIFIYDLKTLPDNVWKLLTFLINRGWRHGTNFVVKCLNRCPRKFLSFKLEAYVVWRLHSLLKYLRIELYHNQVSNMMRTPSTTIGAFTLVFVPSLNELKIHCHFLIFNGFMLTSRVPLVFQHDSALWHSSNSTRNWFWLLCLRF